MDDFPLLEFFFFLCVSSIEKVFRLHSRSCLGVICFSSIRSHILCFQHKWQMRCDRFLCEFCVCSALNTHTRTRAHEEQTETAKNFQNIFEDTLQWQITLIQSKSLLFVSVSKSGKFKMNDFVCRSVFTVEIYVFGQTSFWICTRNRSDREILLKIWHNFMSKCH